MEFRSCWFESDSADAGFLRESGFDKFPALVPRWATNGETEYGLSPGMEALPDVKMLQAEQSKKLIGLDKLVDPPMKAPASLAGVSVLPGAINYVTGSGVEGFSPLYEVQPDLRGIREDIIEVQARIDRSFHKDIFLMISSLESSGRTATEIMERREEKLLVLGPLVEKLETELLDPLIDRPTFEILYRRGLIPMPPAELRGAPLRVEYLSILSQAQRALGTAAMDRLWVAVANVAQFQPDAIDKINVDEWVDAYADKLGTPASIVRGDDEVDEVRAKRRQQQMAAAAIEAAPKGAGAAKAAGETAIKPGSDTALTRTLEALGLQT